MGMWAGVTVSVLSVQLRFQAQTQLRQTFDDSAQNTQNADHAGSKFRRASIKFCFTRGFVFLLGPFSESKRTRLRRNLQHKKKIVLGFILRVKKNYDWYKSTKFFWKFTLLVPNKIKLSGNFFVEHKKIFDVGDVQ
jgi:hypothetical protein